MSEQLKETIMVVDDTPDNLTLLGEILNEAGYRTLLFPRADLSLKAALRNQPDLFLLDIMMPDINGYELCTRLKKYTELQDIPVIYISALDDTQSKVEAFARGAVDYISKPFQEKEVLARIKTHLKLQRVQRELEYHNSTLEERVADQTADLLHAQSIARFGNWKHHLRTGETEWSTLTYDIFGVKAGSKVTNDHLFLAIHPDDSDKIRTIWNEFLNGKINSKFDSQYRIVVNNQIKWVHSIAAYQTDPLERPVKIIGAVRDITERKMYIQKLSTKNKTLQDLAWKQSHSFRAPLTRLMGLIDHALDEQLNVLPFDELMNQIRISAEELDSTVREISQQITESQNENDDEN